MQHALARMLEQLTSSTTCASSSVCPPSVLSFPAPWCAAAVAAGAAQQEIVYCVWCILVPHCALQCWSVVVVNIIAASQAAAAPTACSKTRVSSTRHRRRVEVRGEPTCESEQASRTIAWLPHLAFAIGIDGGVKQRAWKSAGGMKFAAASCTHREYHMINGASAGERQSSQKQHTCIFSFLEMEPLAQSCAIPTAK
eukprot:2583494-Pleurochrysis_carterae.AAC.6